MKNWDLKPSLQKAKLRKSERLSRLRLERYHRCNKNFIEIKKEKELIVRKKRDPIIPMGKAIIQSKSSYFSNREVLRKHEQQIEYFDTALSHLDQPNINKILEEHKASQKVYQMVPLRHTEKRPPTRY
jgi:plasmid rolling circle replication initiator protein Rep